MLEIQIVIHFFQCGWPSAGTGFPERYSLHPWRHSEAFWTRYWAARSGWPGLSRGDFQRSLPTSTVLWFWHSAKVTPLPNAEQDLPSGSHTDSWASGPRFVVPSPLLALFNSVPMSSICGRWHHSTDEHPNHKTVGHHKVDSTFSPPVVETPSYSWCTSVRNPAVKRVIFRHL